MTTQSYLVTSLLLPFLIPFHIHLCGQMASDAIYITLEDPRNALEMTIAAASLEESHYFLADLHIEPIVEGTVAHVFGQHAGEDQELMDA